MFVTNAVCMQFIYKLLTQIVLSPNAHTAVSSYLSHFFVVVVAVAASAAQPRSCVVAFLHVPCDLFDAKRK